MSEPVWINSRIFDSTEIRWEISMIGLCLIISPDIQWKLKPITFRIFPVAGIPNSQMSMSMAKALRKKSCRLFELSIWYSKWKDLWAYKSTKGVSNLETPLWKLLFLKRRLKWRNLKRRKFFPNDAINWAKFYAIASR